MLDGCVPWPDELSARYRREGYWRGDTLGDLLRQWADAHGGRTALVDGDRRLTFAEFDEAADRLATGFRRLGLKPLDRVVLHLPNRAEFLLTCFALFRAGVIPVFALPAHREHEIGYFCDHAEAVAYFVAADGGGTDYLALAEVIKASRPALRHVVVVGDEVPARRGFVRLQDLMVDGGEPYRPDPSEVAFFLLSGGTTGLPKLIPRTHDDYAYNLRGSAEMCGFDSDTSYLVSLPISHNFPFGCPGALGTLNVGGTVVFAADPQPATVFPLIEAERVTVTALVPALAIRWMEDPQREQHDLSSLRLLQVGGAKLPPEVARRIRPTLGCQLQQVFGMAEGLLNYTRLDDDEETITTTQGRPMSPADEIRIVDPDGQLVPDGEPGELLTQGPYTLRGYYRAEEHNARAFTDGWYRTGDIVRLHGSGNLIVEGRAKDLINRGGEKISAEEVEDLVLSHQAVFNAAAVAMPDPGLGERTCVYVVTRSESPPPTLDDLLEVFRERGVAKQKWPERLEIVDELPLTKVGKVDKGALREDIAAKLGQRPVS